MPRVDTDLYVGTGTRRVRVTSVPENRHLMGPGEGNWWKLYSWWVIPLGFLLLVWPGWLHLGLSQIQGLAVSAPATKTVHVPPPVQAPPAPVAAPSVVKTLPPPPEPEDPLDKLTPEERRQYEIWVLRKP